MTHRFQQKPGLDFTNTYSPTILYRAIGIILAKAAAEDKEITQLDMVTALLESRSNEGLYLKLPKHFIISGDGRVKLKMEQPSGKAKKPERQVIIKLKRNLYGLKQAGHNWYHTLKSHSIEWMEMKLSLYEADIYFSQTGAMIIACVDDLLRIGTKREVEEMKNRINEHFQIKNLGNVKRFL